MPPWVGRSGCEYFHSLCFWMVTPYSTLQCKSLTFSCSWHSYFRGARSTASPIKPTVWSKLQTIGKIVVVLLCNSETVENNLASTIRNIVVVEVMNENQVIEIEEYLDITYKDKLWIEPYANTALVSICDRWRDENTEYNYE